MKTLLSAAVVATAFSLAGPMAISEADAGSRNDRTAVCDYYRDKAYASSRRGHFERANYYWHLFRACQEHRID
ncbi:MAG: hypothetical protein AAF441_27100 [Pseudomonadota bacterium]